MTEEAVYHTYKIILLEQDFVVDIIPIWIKNGIHYGLFFTIFNPNSKNLQHPISTKTLWNTLEKKCNLEEPLIVIMPKALQ